MAGPTMPEHPSAPGATQELAGVLGVGTDLVFVPTFRELTDRSGTTFLQVFTAKEKRYAKKRAAYKGTAVVQHLATIWAIKEATLKAWLGALAAKGIPEPVREDEVVWSQIAVNHSASGAPRVELRSAMRAALEHSLGSHSNLVWHASASFDGDYASAVVVLTATAAAVDPSTNRGRIV